MPRYVVAQDEQSQSDSSDEEEQAQEQGSDVDENGVGDDDEQQTAEEAPAAAHDRKKIKLSLKQKQKDVCHVRCLLLQSCMHGHDAAAAGGCVACSVETQGSRVQHVVLVYAVAHQVTGIHRAGLR